MNIAAGGVGDKISFVVKMRECVVHGFDIYLGFVGWERVADIGVIYNEMATTY